MGAAPSHLHCGGGLLTPPRRCPHAGINWRPSPEREGGTQPTHFLHAKVPRRSGGYRGLIGYHCGMRDGMPSREDRFSRATQSAGFRADIPQERSDAPLSLPARQGAQAQAQQGDAANFDEGVLDDRGARAALRGRTCGAPVRTRSSPSAAPGSWSKRRSPRSPAPTTIRIPRRAPDGCADPGEGDGAAPA